MFCRGFDQEPHDLPCLSQGWVLYGFHLRIEHQAPRHARVLNQAFDPLAGDNQLTNITGLNGCNQIFSFVDHGCTH